MVSRCRTEPPEGGREPRSLGRAREPRRACSLSRLRICRCEASRDAWMPTGRREPDVPLRLSLLSQCPPTSTAPESLSAWIVQCTIYPTVPSWRPIVWLELGKAVRPTATIGSGPTRLAPSSPGGGAPIAIDDQPAESFVVHRAGQSRSPQSSLRYRRACCYYYLYYTFLLLPFD